MDLVTEPGVSSADETKVMNITSSDISGSNLSGIGPAENAMNKDVCAISETKLKGTPEQVVPEVHLYFELANDHASRRFPDMFPSFPRVEIRPQQESHHDSTINHQELSGEVFVDNILYESSEGIPKETVYETVEPNTNQSGLYFVLEDTLVKPNSSNNLFSEN